LHLTLININSKPAAGQEAVDGIRFPACTAGRRKPSQAALKLIHRHILLVTILVSWERSIKLGERTAWNLGAAALTVEVAARVEVCITGSQ
jgi:hypothetical protein